MYSTARIGLPRLAGYACRMDTSNEARIERHAAIILQGLKRTSTRALLIGVAFGLAAGIGLGVIIGARFFG